jgi:hypothetical protein
VGGIAGELESGAISAAKMSGDIELGITGTENKYAGGIVGNVGGQGGILTNNEVVLGSLKIHSAVPAGSQNVPGIYAGGIAGSVSTSPALLQACSTRLGTLELSAEGCSPNTYAGGLYGNTSTAIENSYASFESITVAGTDTKATNGYPTVYVGGLIGSGYGNITRSRLEGTGSITVSGEAEAMFYVGGLAGMGSISRSHIGYGIEVSLEVGAKSRNVYAGGLTGNGSAEYSFIGSKTDPASVTVTKTGDDEVYYPVTYVGGISGYGGYSLNFQYNYAFCDVSLEISGSGGGPQQTTSVGGFAGYLNGACTQSYAAGSVRLTNNTTNESAWYVGGIAGSVGFMDIVVISNCAALNPEVSISGKENGKWGRIIGYMTLNEWTENTTLATLQNNITTVTAPADYTPEDGTDTRDGTLKDSITKDDFTNWDFADTWDWDDVNNLPVLKTGV